MSLHLIGGEIGKWCSVISELFGEALWLLYRSDKRVVVLRQVLDRFACSFGQLSCAVLNLFPTQAIVLECVLNGIKFGFYCAVQ